LRSQGKLASDECWDSRHRPTPLSSLYPKRSYTPFAAPAIPQIERMLAPWLAPASSKEATHSAPTLKDDEMSNAQLEEGDSLDEDRDDGFENRQLDLAEAGPTSWIFIQGCFSLSSAATRNADKVRNHRGRNRRVACLLPPRGHSWPAVQPARQCRRPQQQLSCRDFDVVEGSEQQRRCSRAQVTRPKFRHAPLISWAILNA